MKLLNISEEIEKSLITLFDVALKAGGTSILAHIDSIRNAVQVPPSVPSPVVPLVQPTAVEPS